MLPNIDNKIFDVPIKSKFGCKLHDSDLSVLFKRVENKISNKLGKVPVGTNYFDFNIKFNSDNSFSSLITEQINDLNNRNVIGFLDLTKIILKYQNKEVSSELIKTLVALEIHLKNGKKLPISMENIC